MHRNIAINRVLPGLFITALAFTGCEGQSDQRAGSDAFRIIVPTTVMEVRQGEHQPVQVTLERGKNYKQRVKLELKAPGDIQVEPKDATIRPSDKSDVHLKITPAKDAAIGEHRIKVKGTPDQGESAEREFTITVRAK